MFRYGLYLLDGEQNVFKEQLIPVEGMLYVPGTKVVAVWGELHYKGATLVENLPYKEDQFDEKAVDDILKKIIKRLKNKIEFIESLQGGQNGNYEGKKYSHIIICDKKVFLEGDKLTLLRNDFDALLFQIKSNVEKIAEHLGREEIFIDGLSAIKEEEKDEILKLLV